MIYMTPQLGKRPLSPQWGVFVNPKQGNATIPDGRPWCLDNGVFSGDFDEGRFWKTMNRLRPYQSTCLFVVAPDVVGNAIATMDSYRYWGCRLKAAGWPVAFVAQDGQELYPFPPEFDCLFVGGSTVWKMSNEAIDCIHRAKLAGKWVHVGRVNSQKRLRHFQLAGVDSADGTGVAINPGKNYPVIDFQLRSKPLFTL